MPRVPRNRQISALHRRALGLATLGLCLAVLGAAGDKQAGSVGPRSTPLPAAHAATPLRAANAQGVRSDARGKTNHKISSPDGLKRSAKSVDGNRKSRSKRGKKPQRDDHGLKSWANNPLAALGLALPAFMGLLLFALAIRHRLKWTQTYDLEADELLSHDAQSHDDDRVSKPPMPMPAELAEDFSGLGGEKLQWSASFAVPQVAFGSMAITSKRLLAVYERPVFDLLRLGSFRQKHKVQLRLPQVLELSEKRRQRGIVLVPALLCFGFFPLGTAVSALLSVLYFAWRRSEISVQALGGRELRLPVAKSEQKRAIMAFERAVGALREGPLQKLKKSGKTSAAAGPSAGAGTDAVQLSEGTAPGAAAAPVREPREPVFDEMEQGDAPASRQVIEPQDDADADYQAMLGSPSGASFDQLREDVTEDQAGGGGTSDEGAAPASPLGSEQPRVTPSHELAAAPVVGKPKFTRRATMGDTAGFGQSSGLDGAAWVSAAPRQRPRLLPQGLPEGEHAAVATATPSTEPSAEPSADEKPLRPTEEAS